MINFIICKQERDIQLKKVYCTILIKNIYKYHSLNEIFCYNSHNENTGCENVSSVRKSVIV